MTPNALTEYPPLLSGWDLSALEAEEGSVFGISADLRLSYTSGGWTAFALENGGGQGLMGPAPLGMSVLSVTPPPLLDFYAALFSGALRSSEPRTHVYECSSPDTHRRFRMTLYLLRGGRGLLITNSPVQSVAVADGPYAAGRAEPRRYVANGIVTQCAHCRRFRRAEAGDIGRWAWVGAWLEAPPAPVSHGLCIPCLEYHFPA